MIAPDTPLVIYEIRGDPGDDLPDLPDSFIGVWNEDDFSYVFFSSAEDEYINSVTGPRNLEVTSRHEMTYRDWQTGLPEAGLSVAGVRFVTPGRGGASGPAIELDPSVTFGDGSHPTTLCCLRFMEKLVREHRISSMLDLGTGSGILALAAAYLGVGNILAVDKNRLATRTARENVRINDYGASIRVEEGEARVFLDKPFDLVMANLPFQVLRDLASTRGNDLHDFWIVSGINQEQGELIQDLFSDRGYSLVETRRDPPWVTFILARSSVHIPTDSRDG